MTSIKQWLKLNFKADDYICVTGSTSGIGYEYAKRFAELGCNLICVSNESNKLDEIAAALSTKFNIKIKNLSVDLAKPQETLRVVKELEALPIVGLVNNAGFGLKGSFEKHSSEEYVDNISVNAIAPVIFLRTILPKMQIANRGLIIHTASINALVPIPRSSVYSATKSFCLSYASAVARENKNSGIFFQIVLPGTTKTPFHERQGATPQALFMQPEDVVARSLQNIGKSICLPNRIDRVVTKIIPFLPKKLCMDIASYMLKKRLGA